MNNDFSQAEKADIRRFCTGKAMGHYRTTCPACSPNRRNKKAQCLSVTINAEHVTFNCHHCERGGATFLKEDSSLPYQPAPYQKPKSKAVKRLDVALSEAADDFLGRRAISARTAQAFSLVAARAYFPDLSREDEAIAYPYYVNGSATGHKVRCVIDKAHVCDTALSSLFGIQNVDLSESSDIIITEGEMDALATYEAGIVNAVSVPNGSSSFTRSNEDGTQKEQMGFLWDAKDKLDKAKRILIATDMDEAGEKLAEELARRIGRHRCWRVRFPEKDANDTLIKHGKEALVESYETAEPWPVDGLYEADKYFDAVDELYRNGYGERVNTGLAAVDGVFSVAHGMLTVVTGIPGNGKSTFVDQIMVNLARSKDYVCGICSFENPPAVHIGKLAAMLCQKHFFETDVYGEKITPEELKAVKPFILRHFKFIHSDDGKKATIESIIERIKTAVLRWGVNIIVIDPFNYLARPAKMESETQWIDEMLTDLRLVAQHYGLHIFMVAHPTKMPMNADGTHQPPKGYSISGSAAWFSKPDFGLTVHREQNGDVSIINWKTRYDWLGKVGETTVFYDNVRHIYHSDNWPDNMPYGDDQ
jgi:twinkle protein